MLELAAMTYDDLPEVSAIERQTYQFPWTYGVFADSLDAKYRAWVGREGDRIVAYALMMVVLDEVHLLNITVAPERQGAGLGKFLLAHLFDDARTRGCRFMFLEVRPSNLNAIALYRRFGFAIIGERRGYYPAVNGREDAVVMSCDLQETAAPELPRAASR